MAATPLQKALAALQVEIDAGYLYQQLSQLEDDPNLAETFRKLGAVEQRHAEHAWQKVQSQGYTGAKPSVSGRARVLSWLGKRFGPQFVLPH